MSRSLRWARFLDAGLRRIRRTLLPPEMVVFEDATAPWLASALGTACHLGLAEGVPEEGCSLEQLSRQLGADPEGLRRLIRVLVSHGYFKLSGDQSQVYHSRLSRSLGEGRAGAFCQLQSKSWYRDCFAADRVSDALRAGQTPFRHLTGTEFFDYTQGCPTSTGLFSNAMAEISRFCAPYVASALHFRKGERVLDIGGGNGRFCHGLKARFPEVQFTVLDLEQHQDSDGIAHLQGSFFEELPDGFDHLILKNVLHDWDDEVAQRILENCARAASKMSVVELLLPERVGEGLGDSDFSVDWNVYCTLGGRERSLTEYKQLFGRAGWRLLKTTPTPTPLHVLHCGK